MSGHDLERSIRDSLLRSRRWHPVEGAFWIAAFAAFLLFPSQLLILNEIAILALFALSLDLILGYAGIVSLGHAAFLGVGAYAAGLVALHLSPDPLIGLVIGIAVSAALGLLTSPLILKGNDLTRLMVTLGIASLLHELANSLGKITGGADGLQGIMMGPLFGRYEFDLFGRTAYLYSLGVLFILFLVARRASCARPSACRSGRSATIPCAPRPPGCRSGAGSRRSTRSPPPMPARPVRCSRRRRSSSRSTCWPSIAPPT